MENLNIFIDIIRWACGIIISLVIFKKIFNKLIKKIIYSEQHKPLSEFAFTKISISNERYIGKFNCFLLPIKYDDFIIRVSNDENTICKVIYIKISEIPNFDKIKMLLVYKSTINLYNKSKQKYLGFNKIELNDKFTHLIHREFNRQTQPEIKCKCEKNKLVEKNNLIK